MSTTTTPCATPWALSNSAAQVCTSTFSGTLDLSRPSQGLRLQSAQLSTGIGQIFQLSFGVAKQPEVAQTAEAFIRGNDLVAIYEPTVACPFRRQIYWRVLEPAAGFAGLELIVSVQTESLDSNPAAWVHSDLQIGKAQRLKDATSAIWEPMTLPAHWNTAPGCLGGTIGDKAGYLEMVHPLDFHVGQVVAAGSGCRTEYQLFTKHLEKGVLLRSRLRVFVGPADLIGQGTRLYQQFAESEPPLTT